MLSEEFEAREDASARPGIVKLFRGTDSLNRDPVSALGLSMHTSNDSPSITRGKLIAMGNVLTTGEPIRFRSIRPASAIDHRRFLFRRNVS